MTEIRSFESFRRLAHEKLDFLIAEYGFQESEAKLFLPAMWILFRNATTQVAVHFEYGSGVWIQLGRLTLFDGRVVAREQYALNFLLSVRAPDLDREYTLLDFDQDRFADIMGEVAIALKLHARDVLRGDFTIFARLEQVRAERFARRVRDAETP